MIDFERFTEQTPFSREDWERSPRTKKARKRAR